MTGRDLDGGVIVPVESSYQASSRCGGQIEWSGSRSALTGKRLTEVVVTGLGSVAERP